MRPLGSSGITPCVAWVAPGDGSSVDDLLSLAGCKTVGDDRQTNLRIVEGGGVTNYCVMRIEAAEIDSKKVKALERVSRQRGSRREQ